ncbi:MAG: glycosyltransferase, partial [Candidatus Omnitrophota bacterium]
ACLKPQKDPFAFLKLAVELKKEITGIKFLLVGDGLLREKIISFLHDNDLDNDVILTGWREDIPSLLSIMNVFVLTSLWEGLPVVILEAMAAGVAVVATDTGGVVDVIIPGLNGDLVKPGDIKSMSVKIVVLLRDHKIRNCYIKQARLRVNEKEFSIDEAVGCVQAVYENGLQRMKA